MFFRSTDKYYMKSGGKSEHTERQCEQLTPNLFASERANKGSDRQATDPAGLKKEMLFREG